MASAHVLVLPCDCCHLTLSRKHTHTASSLSLTYTFGPVGHLHSPKIIPRGKDFFFFTKVNILKLLAFVTEGLFSCSDRGIPIFTWHPDKT